MKFHKTKILVLGSSPVDMDQLGVTAEFMAIDAQLRARSRLEQFELYSAWEVRAEMLPGLLARFEPHIVHFGGHGNEYGELLFQREDGRSHAPARETIADVFRIVPAAVRCVVLNACHSFRQAELVSQHVDVAIGMKGSIEDGSAVAFAAGFYESLSYGKSAATAFEWAQARMKLADLANSDVPAMSVRPQANAAKIFLTGGAVDPSSRVDDERTNGEQLHRLLVSAFSIPELRRFLAFSVDKTILAEIAFVGSISDVSFEVIAVLESRGLVNDALRAALVRHRPGRALEIAKIFDED